MATISVRSTPHEIHVSCTNKPFSEKWLPFVVDLPLTSRVSSCGEKCLDALRDDLSEFPEFSISEIENGFNIEIQSLRGLTGVHLSRVFYRVFPVLEYKKVASFVPKKELVVAMKTASTCQELITKVLEISHHHLKEKVLEKYGTETWEFLRRVSPDQLCDLLKEVELCELNEEEIKQFQSAISWDDAALKDPIKALKAFFNQHIDVMRLSTILLYCECQTYPTFEDFLLFTELGEVNETALTLLKEGFHGYYSELEIQTFIKLARELPCNEAQFFKISYNIELDRKIALQKYLDLFGSQINAIEFFIHINNFRLNILVNQSSLIVIPPQLHFALYQAKFKGNAMRPNPVLGLSKGPDFEHTDQRDVLIPLSTFIRPPSQADNIKTDGIGFYYHDLTYHFFTEGANVNRAAWIELAKFFKAQGKIKLWMMLVDRDFGVYRAIATPFPDNLAGTEEDLKAFSFLRQLNDNEKFWITLAHVKQIQVNGKLGTKNEESFWPMAIDYIIANEESWSKHHEIDLTGLKSLVNKIRAEPIVLKNEATKMMAKSLLTLHQLVRSKVNT